MRSVIYDLVRLRSAACRCVSYSYLSVKYYTANASHDFRLKVHLTNEIFIRTNIFILYVPHKIVIVIDTSNISILFFIYFGITHSFQWTELLDFED